MKMSCPPKYKTRKKENIILTEKHLSRLPDVSSILIFRFCWLKLSMMTPMKRLRVKKEPKMMKTTKYRYM